jgi:hypothetical protein
MGIGDWEIRNPAADDNDAGKYRGVGATVDGPGGDTESGFVGFGKDWDCMAVVEGIDPREEGQDTIDGHPFFQQQMLARYGRIVPCPKCGGKLRTRQAGDKHHCPIYCEACKKGMYEWDLDQEGKEG